MKYGYTRTSTKDKQDDDLQRRALRDASVDEGQIFSDGIDPSTREGRLLLGQMTAFAEYERELVQERVQAGVDAGMVQGDVLPPPGRGSGRRSRGKSFLRLRKSRHTFRDPISCGFAGIGSRLIEEMIVRRSARRVTPRGRAPARRSSARFNFERTSLVLSPSP